MKSHKVFLSILTGLVFWACLGLKTVQASPDVTGWVGKWFKLSVRSTGVSWLDGSKIKNDNHNSVIYLQIRNLNSPSELKATLWQNSQGGWEAFAYDFSVTILGGTDLDFLCISMIENNAPFFGEFLGFVARVTGKQTNGELSSATFKSLGGFHWEHTAVGADAISEVFASGESINGSLIDPSQLPFTP